jgi:hypothetical protein
MRNRNKVLIAGASVLALAAAGGGIAVAGGGEDAGESEAPITGSALDRAGAAAVDHVGGGQVSDTEVGDEESYYEVEVTREDGTQVDVQLDRGFEVVGQEGEAGETEDD